MPETKELVADTAQQIGYATMEKLLMKGDLATLTPKERVDFYGVICGSLGLNPLTRPFDYIQLNGKLTLYAKKDCTEQLRKLHTVSVAILAREVTEGIYVVTARASLSSGRQDESIGAVPIEGKKGEDRANAMMKSETKAKRRVTLSICGLGLLDESEIESIADAKFFKVDPVTGDIEGQSKATTYDVKLKPEIAAGAEPEKQPEAKAEPDPEKVEYQLALASNDQLTPIAGELHHTNIESARLRGQAIANKENAEIVILVKRGDSKLEEVESLKPPAKPAPQPVTEEKPTEAPPSKKPEAAPKPNGPITKEMMLEVWGNTANHLSETSGMAAATAEGRLKTIVVQYFSNLLDKPLAIKEATKVDQPELLVLLAKLRSYGADTVKLVMAEPGMWGDALAEYRKLNKYLNWPPETWKLAAKLPETYPGSFFGKELRVYIEASGLSEMARLPQAGETLTPEQTYEDVHAFLRAMLVARSAGILLLACRKRNLSFAKCLKDIETRAFNGKAVESISPETFEHAIEAYIGQIGTTAKAQPPQAKPEPVAKPEPPKQEEEQGSIFDD